LEIRIFIVSNNFIYSFMILPVDCWYDNTPDRKETNESQYLISFFGEGHFPQVN